MRAAAVWLALALLPGAAAAEPIAVVRATLDRTERVVRSDAPRNDKLASLEAIARELIDADAMAQRTLGEELLRQSPQDRSEFVALFDTVIVRAYLRRLLLFRDPRFDFVRQDRSGDQARVYTRILTRKDAFHIDYELQRGAAGWLATDIVIEGVSLAGNYREQFQSLLRSLSFEQLLERMRRKVGPGSRA